MGGCVQHSTANVCFFKPSLCMRLYITAFLGYPYGRTHGRVAELVYALVLGTSTARFRSSSLLSPTGTKCGARGRALRHVRRRIEDPRTYERSECEWCTEHVMFESPLAHKQPSVTLLCYGRLLLCGERRLEKRSRYTRRLKGVLVGELGSRPTEGRVVTESSRQQKPHA